MFFYLPATASAAPLLKLGLQGELPCLKPLRFDHSYPARCPEQSLVHGDPKKLSSSSLSFKNVSANALHSCLIREFVVIFR